MEAIGAELSALVLGPLQGKTDAECERGPAGKWSPAQIVEHLALGMTLSADTFERRRGSPPMARRPRTPRETITTFFIFGLRWIPSGRKAPERTVPAAQTARAAAEAHFRAALAAWERLARELLPARRADLFVKHPRMGDLTLEEWLRFHRIHARHHARQIRARVGGNGR